RTRPALPRPPSRRNGPPCRPAGRNTDSVHWYRPGSCLAAPCACSRQYAGDRSRECPPAHKADGPATAGPLGSNWHSTSVRASLACNRPARTRASPQLTTPPRTSAQPVLQSVTLGAICCSNSAEIKAVLSVHRRSRRKDWRGLQNGTSCRLRDGQLSLEATSALPRAHLAGGMTRDPAHRPGQCRSGLETDTPCDFAHLQGRFDQHLFGQADPLPFLVLRDRNPGPLPKAPREVSSGEA